MVQRRLPRPAELAPLLRPPFVRDATARRLRRRLRRRPAGDRPPTHLVCGVVKAAEILRADIVRTLQLLGVTSVDELGPQHVRFREEPTPTAP